MPWISKRKIGRPNDVEKTEGAKRHNEKWSKYYGDKRWKKLRNWYITNHPLCESCLFNGRSVPAEEVHHKIPFATGETMEDRFRLLLDPSNVMSVCRECHQKIHNELKSQQ